MDTNRSDPFLTKARDRLATLSRDDTLLAAQEEGVRRKRAELQQAMADLRRSTDVYLELMGIGETTAPGQIAVVFDGADGQGTLSDLAFKALQAHGGRGRIVDIVGWLQEMGRLPKDPAKAQTQYSSVYTALLRDQERVMRAGRGEFVTIESTERVPVPGI